LASRVRQESAARRAADERQKKEMNQARTLALLPLLLNPTPELARSQVQLKMTKDANSVVKDITIQSVDNDGKLVGEPKSLDTANFLGGRTEIVKSSSSINDLLPLLLIMGMGGDGGSDNMMMMVLLLTLQNKR
jgi:hypothetical protein